MQIFLMLQRMVYVLTTSVEIVKRVRATLTILYEWLFVFYYVDVRIWLFVMETKGEVKELQQNSSEVADHTFHR